MRILIGCSIIISALLGISLGCAQTTQQTGLKPELNPAPVNYDFFNRDVTNQAEIEGVIGSAIAGYLIVDGEAPDSVLVNYIYRAKRVYFPLTPAHADIIRTLKSKPKVCFGVDKYTIQHWWCGNIFGTARIINDPTQVSAWLNEYKNALGAYGFNYPMANEAANTVIVEITPEEMSGRKMNDPANPNYAARLPWVSLSGGKASPEVASRTVPAEVAHSEVSLSNDIKVTGLPSYTVESILRGVGACRLNMIGSEYPYSIPMSVMSYANGKVIMHSNKKGHKMDCLRSNQKVTVDYQWFWNNSQWIDLHLAGHIEIVEKPEDIAKVLGGGNPMMFSRMAERMSLLVFIPEKVASRQVDAPASWYPQMPGVKNLESGK